MTHALAPFGLRLMPRLRDAIEAAAAENKRSLNAEITARLETSFAVEDKMQLRFQDAVKMWVGIADRLELLEEGLERVALAVQELQREKRITAGNLNQTLERVDKVTAVELKRTTGEEKKPVRRRA